MVIQLTDEGGSEQYDGGERDGKSPGYILKVG